MYRSINGAQASWVWFWFRSLLTTPLFRLLQPTKYLVEIGRVAVIDFGADAGKLVTIVDVIDQNRALVDGTPGGVSRQAIQFKRLRLTKFRLDIPHGTSSKVVKKVYAAEEIDNKFASTPLALRLKQRSLVSKLWWE